MSYRVVLIVIGIVFSAQSNTTFAKRGSPVMQRLMKNKLEQLHKLQTAMVMEDYKEIDRRASLLIDIAKDATWQSLRTPDYQRYSRIFQDASLDLKARSKEKKLDRVMMPFLRLNMACLECHSYVRNK